MNKLNARLITSTVHPPMRTPLIAIADSGASSHYLTKADEKHCTHIKRTTFGPRVKLPDNSRITATHSMQLNLHPALSSKAQKAHSFDNLKSGSLLSIGQLCDDDCVDIL